MKLLILDGHTILWAIYEPEKLSKLAKDAIADEDNDLFASMATLWEIANKAAAYRLPLVGSSIEELFRRIEELGVQVLPITQADILMANQLPRHHADPFDRILVAQANAHAMQLVTNDKKIALYDVDILWR